MTKAQTSSCGPPCGGMNILEVGVHMKGYEVLDFHGIRYAEINSNLLKKGFTVALKDTSYSLKSFVIFYQNDLASTQLPINGNKVNIKNATFLKTIKPGDQFQIGCINIIKEGFTSLSTSFEVTITK